MGISTNIYGLDIEIDTRRGGVDPAVSTVLTIALCGPGFDDVFIGDEFEMLRAFHVANTPAGSEARRASNARTAQQRDQRGHLPATR